MEAFLDAVDHLHDAVLREVAIVSRGYVALDRWTSGDLSAGDARLFFQSQSADVAGVEVFCDSLVMIAFEPSIELEASGLVTPDEVTLFLEAETQSDRSRVVAKRMSYRLLGPSSLGESHRFVSNLRSTDRAWPDHARSGGFVHVTDRTRHRAARCSR